MLDNVEDQFLGQAVEGPLQRRRLRRQGRVELHVALYAQPGGSEFMAEVLEGSRQAEFLQHQGHQFMREHAGLADGLGQQLVGFLAGLH